jgi:hypothetical protein
MADINSVNLQVNFFEYLKQVIPAHVSMADELAELLNLSSDSIYRRMRGETLLTFGEIHAISHKYKVSVDGAMHLNNKYKLFFSKEIEPGRKGLIKHLISIHNQLLHIALGKDVTYYFIAKDITIFHYFNYPVLSSFKLLFWIKTIMQTPEYAKKLFDPFEWKDDISTICKGIFDVYNSIPSVEIWNVECLNSTLRQINYYKSTGIFKSSADIKNVYDELLQFIDHMELQAERGAKPVINNNDNNVIVPFELYFNEIFMGDNSMLIIRDGIKQAYLNYGELNYLMTRDDCFCDQSQDFMQSIIRKSTRISSSSEKERSFFFNSLRETVRASEKM